MISLIICQLILCYIVADFITGVVHHFEDTWGLPSWPLIGRTVIVDNINHHKMPLQIGDGSTFWGRTGYSFMLAGVVFLIMWPLGLLYWQVIVTGIIACFGNEVHCYAHRKASDVTDSKIIQFTVKLLHEMAIIQLPQHHAKHHRGAHDTCFCTISNLVNPVLERIRFWKSLEWVVSKLGISVKRGDESRDGF